VLKKQTLCASPFPASPRPYSPRPRVPTPRVSASLLPASPRPCSPPLRVPTPRVPASAPHPSSFNLSRLANSPSGEGELRSPPAGPESFCVSSISLSVFLLVAVDEGSAADCEDSWLVFLSPICSPLIDHNQSGGNDNGGDNGGVSPGYQVVAHNTESPFQVLELSRRIGLDDIEKAEKQESCNDT